MMKAAVRVVVVLCLALIKFSGSTPSQSLIRPIAKPIGNVRIACHVLDLFGYKPDCHPSSNLSSQLVRGDHSVLMPSDISTGTILLFNFSLGDTHQEVSLISDTTIDLSFLLCQPCRDDCSLQSNIAVYNSTYSHTFREYTCDTSTTDCLASRYTACSNKSCTYNYQDYPTITTKGFLATDIFFSENDQAPPVPIVFGCGTVNTGYFGNSVGYLGLGLGNLSFVSQLNVSIFSYCFSSDSFNNKIFFGPDVQLRTASASSTKLLPNRRDPVLYYVNMTGISVGGKRVDILSAAYHPQPDGSGGMVIDSASSLTVLEESAYHAMKNEFIKQIQLPQVDASAYDLDLCFVISPEDDDDMVIPSLTLHFDGKVDMNQSNYFMKDLDGKTLCLMMLPAEGISILGNLMQMDMQMVFDIANSVLRFESVNCHSLSN